MPTPRPLLTTCGALSGRADFSHRFGRVPQVTWDRPVAKSKKKTPPALASVPSCVALPMAVTYQIRGNTPRGTAGAPLPSEWTELYDENGRPAPST